MHKSRKFFSFAEFREHVLSIYLGYYPTLASSLGLHEYDGFVEDYSAPRREQYLNDLRSALETYEQDFHAKYRAHLAADDLSRFECRSIEWKLRDEIFRLTELREFEWNPMIYNDQLELTHLTDRDFAPITERMRSVLLRLRSYPRVLAIARQNLSAHLDRTIVETGIGALQGRLEFLEGLPDRTFSAIEDPELLEDLKDALQSAKLAISSFIEAVQAVVLPHALYDSFRLGPDLLERFIHSSELVEDSLETLVDKGNQELDRLTLELFKVCEELDPHLGPREVFHTYIESEHFSEQNILRETENMLERIRAFVIREGLIAIPSEVRCTVKETPAHMRWAFAAMFSPGAFEQVATEAFYYITLPEPDWDEAKRKDFLHGLNRSVLEIVSIHEAYPGHYTHFLHLHNVKSKVGKCFWSYAFLEGWAHYTEEMMIEAGWGEDDARIRLAYIQEALIRAARYLASLELHSGTMTLSEAQQLFEEKALLHPVAARREAERGVFDPGYLFYTLGKFQIKELRARLERANEDFSLYDFHNTLLSFGTPPVKIVAEMMET
ncbi:MAG: DUF885 domain-containing protein [Candidatus Kapaibacterium sp.]